MEEVIGNKKDKGKNNGRESLKEEDFDSRDDDEGMSIFV